MTLWVVAASSSVAASPGPGVVHDAGIAVPATVVEAPSAESSAATGESAVGWSTTASLEQLPLGEASTPLLRDTEAGSSGGGGWVLRTLSALGVVIFLMFGLRWLVTKASGVSGTFRAQLGAGGRAPSGVLFVLGRYPVSRGLSLVLVRIDRRVLLLSQSGDGFRTLSTFDDPERVASLVRASKDASGASASAGFAKLLKSLERDPSVTGESLPVGSDGNSTGDTGGVPTDVIVETKSRASNRASGRRTDLEA